MPNDIEFVDAIIDKVSRLERELYATKRILQHWRNGASCIPLNGSAYSVPVGEAPSQGTQSGAAVAIRSPRTAGFVESLDDPRRTGLYPGQTSNQVDDGAFCYIEEPEECEE